VKAKIPRISGYPHPVIFRISGPSRNTSSIVSGSNPLRASPSSLTGDLLYFCFLAADHPPALLLFLLSWTPMETVASWHGEVNYKRYQSLGVVGWLVGLGSTDSQLPLCADPRARAIPSSLALLPSLPPSLSFSLATALSVSFYLIHQRFLPSLVDPSSSPQ